MASARGAVDHNQLQIIFAREIRDFRIRRDDCAVGGAGNKFGHGPKLLRNQSRARVPDLVLATINFTTTRIQSGQHAGLPVPQRRQLLPARETAAIGFCKISASALMAASPTRNPVNDPGPEATAKASMSVFARLCLVSNEEICGTSCAEKVPPSSETSSRVREAPSLKSHQGKTAVFSRSVGGEDEHGRQ